MILKKRFKTKRKNTLAEISLSRVILARQCFRGPVSVELKGLNVDLQRAADGTTNWDDLIKSTTTTTTTDEETETEVEVEGSNAAIAALAVGGIEVSDANVSWLDAQSGTDAKLSNFNLTTGAIELGKPFDLNTQFNVASKSMDIAADIAGNGTVAFDLETKR